MTGSKAIHKQKERVRNEMKALRDSLPVQTRKDESTIIQEKTLSDHDWIQARTIMTYVHLKSEVRTDTLIRRSFELKKCVLVPVITGPATMDALHVHHVDDISAPGPYGTRQPRPGSALPFHGVINVIIVPGIVFDVHGGRIGFGKGYYDSFLKDHTRAIRIGLAFDYQIKDRIPQTDDDVRIHRIITEKRIINVS